MSEAIGNLETLIDIFCMYDKAVLLPGSTLPSNQHSDLLQQLTLNNFFASELVKPDEIALLQKTASTHLMTFASGTEHSKFEALTSFALSSAAQFYTLSGTPPVTSNEVNEGSNWIKALPESGDALATLLLDPGSIRSASFFIRSFLYLAFSDLAGLVLVPDSARLGLIRKIAAVEWDLRARLLNAVYDGAGRLGDATASPNNPSVLTRPSALAAVVFKRSQPEKRRIPFEMDALRAELAPTRSRLRVIENTILFGTGKESVRALNEFRTIEGELKTRYGPEERLIDIQALINFGHAIVTGIDTPRKVSTWLSLLLALPVEIIERLVARRHLVELHRTLDETPGPGSRWNILKTLFGTFDAR